MTEPGHSILSADDAPAALGQPGSSAGRGDDRRDTRPLGAGTGLGLGIGVLWLSLVVLLPLAAIVVASTDDGWSGFYDTVTGDAVAAALKLSIGMSLFVAFVNAIMGTLVAWVLVRDPFPGRRVLEVIIDVPFALPTIVAGLVLITLYGPMTPIGLELVGTRKAIFVALLFVTLPFVVRTVQPVLMELDREVEEAAASLGASRFTIFRRIVLPNLAPAIASGAGLCFARAVGEYGSVVLIAGNIPFQTEIASVRILTQIENDQTAAAAATATVLLAVGLLVIIALDVGRRLVGRRG
ncbi:MAG: sulfate transporter, inner rane subunit CysT [Jatrophihabitantaceae bacterium]|nr:sulfate transporter, inner rane subunit CysT [Jatrophihabitantaceae bacterium]